jgi:uncharacterized protein
MNIAKPLIEPSYRAHWLAPYWEGVQESELRLPRCSTCGEWEWYPLITGPSCHTGHYVWQAVSAGASVFTFTHVQRPFLPEVVGPYVVGLVVPDDAPSCRIVTRIEPVTAAIKIGARAKLAFAHDGPRAFPYYTIEAGA